MHDNATLIAGIIVGDEQILNDFYKDNMKYMRGYILKNFGNTEDVEDVFQDALVALYLQLRSDTLELEGSVKAYFNGICKNIWRNRLRQKVKMIITDKLDYFAIRADTCIVTTIENKEKDDLYRINFEKLSTDKKRILHLYFEGKSMRQIAEITGYSEKYARKKKFKVKKELLTMIERDPHFEEYMTA